jgi:hypothetical protein
MYSTLKRSLSQHLQALERHFICLDLSIADWNEIQIRHLESLRVSIDCLHFMIESFASPHEALPPVIQDEISSQVVTIADIAQLLLYRFASTLTPQAATCLQEFIFTLNHIHHDLNAYKTSESLSA